jgi:hypothetical protein
MVFCLFAIALVCIACPWAAAGEVTWVEMEGVVYGARADERGPIGGGAGYAKIVAKGHHVAKDLDGLLEALAKAKAGEVVFVAGEVEIDLTARIYIEQLVLDVPGGVTLAGSRGQHGSEGALLTSDTLKTPVMIRTGGPDVRITGLRLRGPNPKRYLDHHRRSFGKGGAGHKYYNKLPRSNGIRTAHPRLEVDNCEISGFSHAAVDLVAGDGHHVHHCYVHHCQYKGLGYGVCHAKASSLIECNLFDWNRHSIAGGGLPSCSYVARNNVEMGVSLGHCFDMHGGRDRKDGTDIAGTSIAIYNNTFRAPQTPVAIRGVPEDECVVHHNWFVRHADAKQAVRASARTRVFDNVYGATPKAPAPAAHGP